MTEERREWREICVAVVNEQDPVRLLELLEELLVALEREARLRPNGTRTDGAVAND